VFAGGADTESALLGSAVHDAGQLGAVLGTTTPVQLVVGRPTLDAEGNLWTSPHVVPDRWVLESNGGDTGSAYRRLLELTWGGVDAGAHEAAESAMAAVAPGPQQIFCHLGPAVFDLRNMNPFQPAGLLFRFPLLHIDRPNRGELLRAFFDNVAYAIRGNCEQIAAVAGEPTTKLWVSGGMTRSPTLLRLVPTPVRLPLAVAAGPESARPGRSGGGGGEGGSGVRHPGGRRRRPASRRAIGGRGDGAHASRRARPGTSEGVRRTLPQVARAVRFPAQLDHLVLRLGSRVHHGGRSRAP